MASNANAQTDDQWRFLDDAFLAGVIRDSATRGSPVYIAEVTDTQSSDFRKALKLELRQLAASYSVSVTEAQHLQNIHDLASHLSARCGAFLDGGCFNFGRAQKALNVYLKYLWCAGHIQTPPPHCPFDDIIIKLLKPKLPSDCKREWTKTNDEESYNSWVLAAKELAQSEPLAHWELRVWPVAQASLRHIVPEIKGRSALKKLTGPACSLPRAL